MAETLTTTSNYSGMLYTKVDESTRFLDAVYARGKAGGRTMTRAIEFVLSSGYEMDDPSQPDISETDAMIAPDPETTERDQEYNVVQIYQRSVDVSYSKQAARDLMDGVNIAGQANNVPNELDFQIGRRIAQMRMDINHSLLNGAYQYTKGSATIAPRSRGIIPAIQTNLFDAAGDPLSKKLINDAVLDSIKNGADPTAFEVWCNPLMLDIITDTYALIPGSALPSTRTEGGIAYTQILTPYAPLNIEWEPQIPEGILLLVNMGQMAVAEMDIPGKGVLFYEPLAKLGASERGMLYGHVGCDYGAEWHHACIENIAV